MNDAKQISARLAEIAKERGISQKTISKTSGIRETTISRILTGKFAANSAYLCRIADAVGVRIIFDCDCKTTQEVAIRNLMPCCLVALTDLVCAALFFLRYGT